MFCCTEKRKKKKEIRELLKGKEKIFQFLLKVKKEVVSEFESSLTQVV